MSGRQKETNTETYRTKTEEGKQRKGEDIQQTAKESGLLISSASLAPSCVGAGCINTSFPFGPDQPSRTLSAPLLRPSLPSPPCPAPSYPPPPLLHCLIRILGLVKANIPGDPLVQKLILSDVTSQCQGDRC